MAEKLNEAGESWDDDYGLDSRATAAAPLDALREILSRFPSTDHIDTESDDSSRDEVTQTIKATINEVIRWRAALNAPTPTQPETPLGVCVDCKHSITEYSGYACNVCRHRCKSWAAPEPPDPAESCTWSQDLEGVWETKCDNMFEVNNGTPSENSMKFCCYCGKPIKEDTYRDEDDDD